MQDFSATHLAIFHLDFTLFTRLEGLLHLAWQEHVLGVWDPNPATCFK